MVQERSVSLSLREGAGNRNSLGYYTFSEETFKGLTKEDIDTDGSNVISVEELNSLQDVEIGWVFSKCFETRYTWRLFYPKVIRIS